MSKMNVAMYYKNNDVRIEEMSVPKIGDDELLVKVRASGICGSDVMEWYRIKKAPRVLGHEITGDIVKIGKNVKKYRVGDRVFVSHHVPCDNCEFCKKEQHTLCHTLHSTNFYPGGFAEYIRIPKINVEKGVFILPDNLSYDEGVFIEPLACVVRGLNIAGFSKGRSVLVLGSGISGLIHIKILKALGASKIIATDIDEYRLKIADKCGADFTFNAKIDFVDKIKKVNDGKLVDFVVLCTGAVPAVKQALNNVGFGGTVLFFAPTKPGVKIAFPLFDLWNKGVKMVSTYAGSPQDIKRAIDILSKREIHVKDMITHRLPLREAQKGFSLVAKAHESIKVILYP